MAVWSSVLQFPQILQQPFSCSVPPLWPNIPATMAGNAVSYWFLSPPPRFNQSSCAEIFSHHRAVYNNYFCLLFSTLLCRCAHSLLQPNPSRAHNSALNLQPQQPQPPTRLCPPQTLPTCRATSLGTPGLKWKCCEVTAPQFTSLSQPFPRHTHRLWEEALPCPKFCLLPGHQEASKVSQLQECRLTPFKVYMSNQQGDNLMDLLIIGSLYFSSPNPLPFKPPTAALPDSESISRTQINSSTKDLVISHPFNPVQFQVSTRQDSQCCGGNEPWPCSFISRNRVGPHWTREMSNSLGLDKDMVPSLLQQFWPQDAFWSLECPHLLLHIVFHQQIITRKACPLCTLVCSSLCN